MNSKVNNDATHVVTFEEADAFFKAKNINAECSACRIGYMDSSLGVTDGNFLIPFEGFKMGNKFIALTCSNCGYSLFFRTVTISQWLREKQENEDKSKDEQ